MKRAELEELNRRFQLKPFTSIVCPSYGCRIEQIVYISKDPRDFTFRCRFCGKSQKIKYKSTPYLNLINQSCFNSHEEARLDLVRRTNRKVAFETYTKR